MSSHTIYALYDDREPDRWRYVGQTVNPTNRLIDHRFNKTAGIPIEHLAMATLEVVDAGQANEVEAYWIARCALEGCDIANKEGHPDYVRTRRKSRDSTKDEVFVLRINADDRRRMEILSRRFGVSMAGVIRMLLLQSVREDEVAG